MRNKLLYSFLFILISLELYIVILYWPDRVVSANPEKPAIITVIYTNDGFEPATLEVALNSKVLFINLSLTPLWVASDPHPSHSDYPEFDADKNFIFEEEFTFIFDKTGTFGFHNHNNSLHRGIIKVINYENPLPSIDKVKEGKRATRDKFLAMLEPGKPDSVYVVINKIESDPTIKSDCHDMAHDLGHHAYELYGFSSAMTLNDPTRLSHQSVDDICAGGYMHGVVEELFLHKPELKDNPDSICSSIEDKNRGSCFHGVGHSLMFVTRRDVDASLAICKSLPKSVDAHRCYEGVWMEMFWGLVDHGKDKGLGWDPDKPLDRCKKPLEEQMPACYLYAHLGYIREHRGDFAGALKLCTESKLEKDDSLYCVKGIGITMMKHVTSKHLSDSESLVYGLNNDYKTAYYQGVINYARLSSVSEKDLKSFCDALKEDEKICNSVILNYPKDGP